MKARISPALRHKQRVLASTATTRATLGIAPARFLQGANDNPAAQQSPAYAEMMFKLRTDQQHLKGIQSLESKIALKRELLPAYQGWVQGVLSAPKTERGVQDEVLATVMMWMIDVGDFVEAMPLIDYVLRHGLALPERIQRTPATFIVEEIAEAAIKAFTRAQAEPGGDSAQTAEPFPAGVLAMIEDLAEDHDMPDEVRAKLVKAIGMAILDGATDEDRRAREEEALRRYLRAVELDDRVGVKKEIDRLQRSLKKPPADAGAGDASSGDAGDGADQSQADQTTAAPEGGDQAANEQTANEQTGPASQETS